MRTQEAYNKEFTELLAIRVKNYIYRNLTRHGPVYATKSELDEMYNYLIEILRNK